MTTLAIAGGAALLGAKLLGQGITRAVAIAAGEYLQYTNDVLSVSHSPRSWRSPGKLLLGKGSVVEMYS